MFHTLEHSPFSSHCEGQLPVVLYAEHRSVIFLILIGFSYVLGPMGTEYSVLAGVIECCKFRGMEWMSHLLNGFCSVTSTVLGMIPH